MLYIGQDESFLQHGRHYDIKVEKKRLGTIDVLAKYGKLEAHLTYYDRKRFERDWKDDSPRKNDAS